MVLMKMFAAALLVAALPFGLLAAEDGLVAHWAFDEGAGVLVKDMTAAGLDGKIVGAAQWVPGKNGTAIELNGDSYVDCGTAGALDFTSSFTVSLWFKASPELATGNAGWIGLVSRYSADANDKPVSRGYDIGIMKDPGNFEIGARGTSQIYAGNVGEPVLDGAWHHLAVVFQPTGIAVYQDGKPTGSQEGTWVAAPTDKNSFFIGTRAHIAGFKGAVDEMKAYGRALSAAEVAAEFARASSFVPSSLPAKKAETLDAIESNPAVPTSGAAQAPVDRSKVFMSPGGAVVLGDKQLMLRGDGALCYVAGGREVFACILYAGSYRGVTEWWQVGANNITSNVIDPVARTQTITGRIGSKPAYPVEASYRITLRLDEHGLAWYSAKLLGASPKDFGCGILFILPKDTLSKAQVKVDEAIVAIPESLDEGQDFDGKTVELFSDQDDLALTVSAVKDGILRGRDFRKDRANSRYNLFYGFDVDNEAMLSVSMDRISAEKLAAAQSEVFNRFDPNQFEKYNLASLPNYGISRNLVQNPSFEEGLNGWVISGLGMSIADPDYLREWLIIDETTAKHGRRSLRFQLRPTDEYPGMMAPYTVQLTPGKKYTFSFYAKTDVESFPIFLGSVGKVWPKFPHGANWQVTQEWKRYETTITATESIVSFCLGYGWAGGGLLKGLNLGLPKVHVWVDAVQFEEAPAASAFTMKPVAVTMERTAKYFRLDQPKKLFFDLANTTDAARTVTAKVVIRDFIKREVGVREFADVVLAPGAVVPLEFAADDAMNYVGFYSIKVIISDASGYADYDFQKMAVIQPFSKEENLAMKNRLTFTIGNPLGNPVHARLLRELGVGAVMPGNMIPWPEAQHKVFTDEGFLVFSGIFGDDPTSRAHPLFGKILKETDLNGQEIKDVLAFLPGYFRENKHLKYWKYFNEPDLKGMDTPGHMMNPKVQVEFMAKVHAILKQEIPDAQVISSDPWENGEMGRRWLREMLMAGGIKYIDILATHPYRSKPEKPDFTEDAFAIIKMADECGFKGPIWFTECGMAPLYTMPALGVFPDKGLSDDGIRLAPFTSDLVGNRSGFAYYARFLLMALRHADRIPMYTQWCSSGRLINDATSTPLEVGVEYNAIARLLGNATFVKEYQYGDTLKAYLFDDGAGKGIVTMWDFDDKIERSERPPLVFRFAAEDGATVTDLFGRPLAVEPDGSHVKFAIDYVPQVIRGTTVAALDAAMTKSAVLVDEADAVGIAIAIADTKSLRMTLRNRDSRDFTGSVKYTLNDQPGTQEFTLKGLSEESVLIPLAGIVDVKLARYTVDLVATVCNASGKAVKAMNSRYNILVCNRKRADIAIDGDLADWAGYSFGAVGGTGDVIEYRPGKGNPKFSARLASAWDADNLYLAVEVLDEKHFQPNTLSECYKGDSLQVFIDSYKDGTEYAPNFEDDYAYLVAKTSAGDQVFRNWTPTRQLCFLDNNVLEAAVEVKIGRDEAAGKTTYEMRFPKKTLMPVAFRENAIIGLAIMVNDASDASITEGERRDAALTTANGKEGYKQPHNLSSLLFE
jgi:hypothetical protein